MTRTELFTTICSKLTKRFTEVASFQYSASKYLGRETILIEKQNGMKLVIDIANLNNSDAVNKIVACTQTL